MNQAKALLHLVPVAGWLRCGTDEKFVVDIEGAALAVGLTDRFDIGTTGPVLTVQAVLSLSIVGQCHGHGLMGRPLPQLNSEAFPTAKGRGNGRGPASGEGALLLYPVRGATRQVDVGIGEVPPHRTQSFSWAVQCVGQPQQHSVCAQISFAGPRLFYHRAGKAGWAIRSSVAF